MPTHADGYLIPFTSTEITAMELSATEVRSGNDGAGHGAETREWNQSTMRRQVFCKFDERYHVIELLLGDSTTWVDTGPVTKISRLLPDPLWGRHQTYPQIMATKIEDMRGWGRVSGVDGNGYPIFPKARIVYTLEHCPFRIRSDTALPSERERYTSRGPSSGEVQVFGPIPGGAFKYTTPTAVAPHGDQVPYNISLSRATEKLCFTWHEVPYSVYATGGSVYTRIYIGDGSDGIPYMGCVNKTDVVITGDATYPAGTLLFDRVEPELLRSPLAGTASAGWRWKLNYHFTYAPRGWLDLYYFNPATPAQSGFHRISNDGTYYTVALMPDKTGLYNVRDLNKLWDPN